MATIIGTPNSETLIGTEFADSILGVGGNDTVNALPAPIRWTAMALP